MAGALTVRPAQAGDAADLAALLGAMGWFKAYAATTPAQAAAHLQALVAAAPDRSLLLVAEDDQHRLCGYCAVHWLPVAILQGWEAYVSELFVAEMARGSGAGSQLLDAAVQAARERRCQRIWLINNRERPSYARGFYPRHGWTEQAEMARFVLPLAPLPSDNAST
ncbi:MAG: GNAT family N-acetyltransferase [Burkholderiaceae bacterium]|nr:GNAT family N-acetyltransferase [Burkholderiaceae bacterium]